MYNKESGIKLNEKSRALLKEIATGITSNAAKTINDLREVINYSDWRYYVKDDPALADQEYDRLFEWLKKLEEQHPESVTPDSPTQRVAKGLTKEFPTVDHLVPMLSLDNSYNAEDLSEWDRRCREFVGDRDIEYCIEPKFDGAGISLIYENDLLTRGATRGDGVQGEDITMNLKQIRSIPLSAKFSSLSVHQIEIRGEVLINKNKFKQFNDQRLAENLPPLANPRNAASGSLRMIDPKEVGKRGLEAFLYHMSYLDFQEGKREPEAFETHYGTLNALSQLGFRTPVDIMKVVKGIDKVIDYCKTFENKRDELPYEIDGLVVKVNEYALQDKMGMTTHHPRWAMAYKFKPRQASSKLRKVEFQVGRTGTITPVAKIDPVPLSGVTVSSISMFNEDVIREKDIRVGDTILVERAGDVIPYIVKPLTDLRNGSEKEIVFPKHCPVCGDKLVKEPGESAWRCVNINCEAQVVERLVHFGSKDAMDIRNLGEANVKRFYELKLLRDIPGIYQLDFEKISQLEGFGKKSVDNLRTAIENSKQQPLHRLIFALGIRFVGETTAKTLAKAFHDLMELKNITEEKLLSLEDIGPKVAGAILQFFSNEDNIRMLEKLRSLGINMKNAGNKETASGTLSGLTFLFTGTLPSLKRSEAETLVESKGGKIAGSVSSKLNYLIAGEEAGSKLEKAKRINTVKILNEEEFLQMIKTE
ncbi:MAG: NAD-dependent DNA ligase LigA [Chitinophagaceae bacterium]|nr:MAG: NAD-dependent DNA ligase LigA [Chitinophagaceae bacterium]